MLGLVTAKSVRSATTDGNAATLCYTRNLSNSIQVSDGAQAIRNMSIPADTSVIVRGCGRQAPAVSKAIINCEVSVGLLLLPILKKQMKKGDGNQRYSLAMADRAAVQLPAQKIKLVRIQSASRTLTKVWSAPQS